MSDEPLVGKLKTRAYLLRPCGDLHQILRNSGLSGSGIMADWPEWCPDRDIWTIDFALGDYERVGRLLAEFKIWPAGRGKILLYDRGVLRGEIADFTANLDAVARRIKYDPPYNGYTDEERRLIYAYEATLIGLIDVGGVQLVEHLKSYKRKVVL